MAPIVVSAEGLGASASPPDLICPPLPVSGCLGFHPIGAPPTPRRHGAPRVFIPPHVITHRSGQRQAVASNYVYLRTLGIQSHLTFSLFFLITVSPSLPRRSNQNPSPEEYPPICSARRGEEEDACREDACYH